MSHTPGPWFVDTGRPGHLVIVAATGAQRLGDPRYVELARVMVKTNARFIIAAPTMYDAIVAMKERVPLKNDAGMVHTCGECRMCDEIAEQALSKAEGREP